MLHKIGALHSAVAGSVINVDRCLQIGMSLNVYSFITKPDCFFLKHFYQMSCYAFTPAVFCHIQLLQFSVSVKILKHIDAYSAEHPSAIVNSDEITPLIRIGHVVLVQSVQLRDYNFFMADTVFYTLIGLASGLVVDLSYGFIDPRIKMGAR